jgi:hypothetical protein
MADGAPGEDEAEEAGIRAASTVAAPFVKKGVGYTWFVESAPHSSNEWTLRHIEFRFGSLKLWISN